MNGNGKKSEISRKALEKEVQRIKIARAKEAAMRLSELLTDVTDEEIIEAIRETRDQR
jgi:hypothetical protein